MSYVQDYQAINEMLSMLDKTLQKCPASSLLRYIRSVVSACRKTRFAHSVVGPSAMVGTGLSLSLELLLVDMVRILDMWWATDFFQSLPDLL